ncbi:hypothetical protein [Thaumasiovibrio sp. DFM-14]|uniref:hypothetical protein n=1 Tax=Thaumasiovibrio sp. DFM-14 TaxID=3384792 RepID=UPI00399EFC51
MQRIDSLKELGGIVMHMIDAQIVMNTTNEAIDELSIHLLSLLLKCHNIDHFKIEVDLLLSKFLREGAKRKRLYRVFVIILSEKLISYRYRLDKNSLLSKSSH